MAAQSKLTPAEKRKLTIAAKAQKEVEENIAFRNQSRRSQSTEVLGGRQAKKDAKKNAVWKADQPVTRKRTASTAAAEASGPAKKARETKSGTDSEGIAEDSEEEPQ
ncbi:hypothetical protein B0H14DRAFT_2583338 [Mycena olivaceomarginata]|nr:hypothetical protein B0H14DRAFT_2583338 [Mycena olivaceomarginata]